MLIGSIPSALVKTIREAESDGFSATQKKKKKAVEVRLKDFTVPLGPV